MKIELRKYGKILTSRPAGREAAMAMKAYFDLKPDDKIELDFSGVVSVGPSWLDEVLMFLREEYGSDRVVCLPSNNSSVIESLKVIDAE